MPPHTVDRTAERRARQTVVVSNSEWIAYIILKCVQTRSGTGTRDVPNRGGQCSDQMCAIINVIYWSICSVGLICYAAFSTDQKTAWNTSPVLWSLAYWPKLCVNIYIGGCVVDCNCNNEWFYFIYNGMHFQLEHILKLWWRNTYE